MSTTEHRSVRTPRPAATRWRLFPADPLRGEGTEARRAWRPAYVRRLVLGDALCATVAAAAGLGARFGPVGSTSPEKLSAGVAVALPVVWVLAMLTVRAYEQRYLWLGPEEFRRVFFAAVMLLALVGTVSWAFRLEIARGFVILAIPMALLLTLLLRGAHRRWLHRGRSRGRFQQTTIIVGHRSAVTALHEQMERDPYHGYRVIGCCIPPHRFGKDEVLLGDLPVLGGLDDVVDVVVTYEVDTVAVLPSPELDGAALRQLGWGLESTDAELLLAPAITEIVGTRVGIRPVSGLPLLHMERPELRGLRRVLKGGFDRTAAALGLLGLLPALVLVGAAVALTSRGPVFFRQQRVGRDGELFAMLKYRTMVDGADRMVADLASSTDGNDVLFKMREDPRVTRVGRLLRRFSVDEIPQLLNVLTGHMSLVGPRPPLPTEVERYGFDMHRRFLVKPGLTGLWQVSGRSDLSWDDSVRIDVRYVENWSLTYDLMILWKTVGAVFRGSGAY